MGAVLLQGSHDIQEKIFSFYVYIVVKKPWEVGLTCTCCSCESYAGFKKG